MSITKLIKKNYMLLSILIVFFLTVFLLSFIDSGLLWDENAYLGNARNIIAHSNYTEDFRFPLLNFLISFIWLFTGESLFAAKLLIMVFGVLSVFIFYLATRFYFDRKKSLFVTSAFSFSYLVLYWSFRVYTDIPGMFFVFLSFYFLLRGINRKNVFLSAISSALAFLMRFPFGLFPFSVVLYFIYKKKFSNIPVFLLSMFIIFIPWFSYNYLAHSGDPLYDLKNQWAIVYTYTTPEPITNHIINLFVSMNILALFIPFGLYRQFKNNAKMRFIIFVYLLIFVAYFFFLSNIKLSRYFIAALPFLYLVSGEGLEYLKKFQIPIVIISLALSVFTISNFVGNNSHCNTGGPLQPSIEYVCSQKPGKVASNFWPYFGYACNSKITGLSSDDLDGMIQTQKPEYIIYSPQYGEIYNKTKLDANKNLRLEKNLTGVCGESVFIYKAG